MTLIDINESDFDQKVTASKVPVLVDFWAPWCGPCRMAEPVLEELSKTYDGKVVFTKVNVDNNGSLAQKFGVMSIPTTIIFKDGQEIARQVGFSGKEAFDELLMKAA